MDRTVMMLLSTTIKQYFWKLFLSIASEEEAQSPTGHQNSVKALPSESKFLQDPTARSVPDRNTSWDIHI